MIAPRFLVTPAGQLLNAYRNRLVLRDAGADQAAQALIAEIERLQATERDLARALAALEHHRIGRT